MAKTVLITGASRGIGAATARIFAESGYSVAINYFKSKEKAIALASEIRCTGGDCEVYAADVSSPSQVDEMVKAIIARNGRIDVLVNNAGVAHTGLFQETTDEQFDLLTGINLRGVFNCIRSVLPVMLQSHSGSIVNVSSVLGVTGGSCEVLYSATKAAIIGMTSALAKEVGPSGVRVNCVAPGVIDTDMNLCHSDADINELRQSTALGEIGSPLQVARAILFFAGDSSDFITGQTLRVDGGLVI